VAHALEELRAELHRQFQEVQHSGYTPRFSFSELMASPSRKIGSTNTQTGPDFQSGGLKSTTTSNDTPSISLLNMDAEQLHAIKMSAAALMENENENSYKNGDDNKRHRATLNKTAVNTLRQYLFDHFAHPYPTDQEKAELAIRTGLKVSQVNYWFINARVRIWRPLLESHNKKKR
jgi:hypothetical protein